MIRQKLEGLLAGRLVLRDQPLAVPALLMPGVAALGAEIIEQPRAETLHILRRGEDAGLLAEDIGLVGLGEQFAGRPDMPGLRVGAGFELAIRRSSPA